MKTIKIVAFGDSITLASRQPDGKKWSDIVEMELRQRKNDYAFSVVNSGVGGNTSREGLERIDSDVIAHDPNYVLVEFGGNDATPVQSRHVSLEEYKENLKKIRNTIVEHTNASVIMLTFPPVIDEWHSQKNEKIFLDFGGQDKFIEQYRQLTRSFAADNDILLIDIDLALRRACDKDGNEKIILSDGVHLTEAGNRIVAKTVVDHLLPLF